jgi:hypothetical protein
MPTFGGVTGRVYCKAWRVPAPGVAAVVFLHGFGEHSGLYCWLGDALTARASTVGARRDRPRAHQGRPPASAEHRSSSPKISRLNSCPAATCSTCSKPCRCGRKDRAS